MTFYIIKGNHYSLPPHFRPHFGTIKQKIEFKFSGNCSYPVDYDNNFFTNKLFGWSYGHHHTDSVRVGWRPTMHSSSKIDLSFYTYNQGKRNIEYFHTVEINKAYHLQIELINNKLIFTLDNYHTEHTAFVIPSFRWGYFLYPYFGGNTTAINNITINLKRLK